MARDPNRERWPEVYRDAPEVFARFGQAEDRESAVPKELEARAGLEGATVLEIGAGTGRWTSVLSEPSERWIATEPAPGMLAIGRTQTAGRAQWVCARSQALPIRTGSVDRVFAGFVFANLRPEDRGPALADARRVLAHDGELWLIENHWDDDFQTLRREAGLETCREIAPLTDEFGLEHVTTLDTRMEFASEAAARAVLGTILGPLVDRQLEQRPQRAFVHRISLLRWHKARSGVTSRR